MSQPGPNPETAALGAAAGAAPTVGAAVGAGAIGVGAMNALGAVVNQGSGGGEGGGRFEYTEEQLRSIKKRWEDLAEDYDADVLRAGPLTQIEGPGDEYVSARYALAANAAGQKVIDSLIERRNYCRAQARKCAEALGEYVETEDEAAREMRGQDDKGGPL
ncbi:hypothetical protein EV191_1011331 [Tamaricihabitans halophyticus]|uniref:PE family protein n=1 Tax=Tamaricihabitans halophyticus TaxID=1262583 RepID=A0A4V2SV71_9PSEU|nr:hypothetical protein [Tamaricihabitans halophyticus]TCP57376.1 hypothetical protein EV191_1011331 [Tamaricihabitans halophyticus]